MSSTAAPGKGAERRANGGGGARGRKDLKRAARAEWRSEDERWVCREYDANALGSGRAESGKSHTHRRMRTRARPRAGHSGRGDRCTTTRRGGEERGGAQGSGPRTWNAAAERSGGAASAARSWWAPRWWSASCAVGTHGGTAAWWADGSGREGKAGGRGKRAHRQDKRADNVTADGADGEGGRGEGSPRAASREYSPRKARPRGTNPQPAPHTQRAPRPEIEHPITLARPHPSGRTTYTARVPHFTRACGGCARQGEQ